MPWFGEHVYRSTVVWVNMFVPHPQAVPTRAPRPPAPVSALRLLYTCRINYGDVIMAVALVVDANFDGVYGSESHGCVYDHEENANA